jgi:MoaA/NifB/PqqE/SkfB family radical SAM enzyme
MQIVPDNDPAELYGRWNALVAFDSFGKKLGAIRAHDGDFFPESILNYVEAIRTNINALRAGESLLVYPLRVDIDVTQDCNAHCTFCFSRQYQKGTYRRSAARLSDVEQVIANASTNGARTIRYCGGGEPTVHPEIHRLLRLPRLYGLKCCIITNGDFFNQRLMDEIFESVDHLRWSVNAAKDETRIKIHRPMNGANALSTSMNAIATMLTRRRCERGQCRKPMVWSTYLVIPENVSEIETAAATLKEIGVDSLSFRPVYHDLTTAWTSDDLVRVSEIFARLRSEYGEPSFGDNCQNRFLLFTPKRPITESPYIRPSSEFGECISRRVRTVLEAVNGGLAVQSCGMYRGSGIHNGLVVTNVNKFSKIWQQAGQLLEPNSAPADCSSCIDVSMNITLNFIKDILFRFPNADFQRALVATSEL